MPENRRKNQIQFVQIVMLKKQKDQMYAKNVIYYQIKPKVNLN